MDKPYRDIELNALDPRTRKRLIEAIDGGGSPQPILSMPSSTGGAIVGWSLLALMSLTVGCVLAILDFGQPYHFAQGWGYLAGYAVCALFVAWGTLGALRSRALDRAMPFKRGRYVFPTDVVIATGSKLRILPMARLVKLDGVHRHVNGAYTGTDLHFHFDGYGRETFLVLGKERAELVLDDLRVAQQRVAEAVQHQDLDMLAALDVFFDARVTDAWNDPAAAARAAQSPEREPVKYELGREGAVASGDPSGEATLAKRVSPIVLRAGTFALAATLLAPPFWIARNYASDERAFVRAQSLGYSDAWNAYLADGGRHREEVIDRWLPEAAFSEAQRAGTVTALREFVRAHPQSRRVAEARAAIHERFVQVRQSFMSQAATSDPRMPEFMGELLAWLEAHDSPPVRVRFLAPSAEALSLIDQNLGELAQLEGVTGGIAPVAPHFTPERSEVRETNITRVLSEGFAPVFPTDVMQLEHAGRITDAQRAEAIEQPVFDVSYTIRPSGSVYTSDTSTRGFVGIFVSFHIEMRIPGSNRVHSIDTVVEPPETFYVPTGYGGIAGDSPLNEGLVYSVMADRAFDQLETRLALAFFREGTPAHQQAVRAAEQQEQAAAQRPNPYGIPGVLPTGY